MRAASEEAVALRRIAANQRLVVLQRRAKARADELRQAPAPVLRYPAARQSVVAIHDQDAQHGVRREKFVMRLRRAA